MRGWLKTATRPAELLTCSAEDGGRSLLQLQVTTRSPMGALAYESGGLLVDDGWVRVLGSPSTPLPRGIADWNRLDAEHRLPGALLVGDDALGGFFAVNGGRLGNARGNVFYLSPDTLEWEDLGATYSQWLTWSLKGDLEQFYGDLRWPGWREDVRSLVGDRAFLVYPFLFTEGAPIAERSRRAVPIEEL